MNLTAPVDILLLCRHHGGMATKSSTKFSGGRPDRYSKKRSGSVSQSVRLSVAENKLVRQASALDRMSINAWSVKILVAAAKNLIAASENE